MALWLWWAMFVDNGVRATDGAGVLVSPLSSSSLISDLTFVESAGGLKADCEFNWVVLVLYVLWLLLVWLLFAEIGINWNEPVTKKVHRLTWSLQSFNCIIEKKKASIAPSCTLHEEWYCTFPSEWYNKTWPLLPLWKGISCCQLVCIPGFWYSSFVMMVGKPCKCFCTDFRQDLWSPIVESKRNTQFRWKHDLFITLVTNRLVINYQRHNKKNKIIEIQETWRKISAASNAFSLGFQKTTSFTRHGTELKEKVPSRYYIIKNCNILTTIRISVF